MKVWPWWCGHLSFFYKSRRLICSVMCKRSLHALTMAHDWRLNFPRCISRCRLENAFLNSMRIKSYWIFNQNLNHYAYDNLPCLNQLLTTAEDGWEGYTFTPKFCFFFGQFVAYGVMDPLLRFNLHSMRFTAPVFDAILVLCQLLKSYYFVASRASTIFCKFFVIMLLSFFL